MTGSFDAAWKPPHAGSEPVASPLAPPVRVDDSQVIDLRDGTVHELGYTSTDVLAELVLAWRQLEADVTGWRRLAEQEIRDRLEAEGRRIAVVGDYELRVDEPKRRAWDADELQITLTGLIDSGVLQVQDVADIIQREVKVNGTNAASLLRRLTGHPKALVEDCYELEPAGKPRLTVTPVPDLKDALPQ